MITRHADLFTFISLIVSILGFSITIFQISRSKSAAERAETAARTAVAQIGNRLTSRRVSTAVHLANEVRQICRIEDWVRVLDRLDQLCKTLAYLTEDSRLSTLEREFVVGAIDDIIIIKGRLDRHRLGKTNTPIDHRNTKTIDMIATQLGRIDGRLESSALETQNV